jgi:predicted nucleic acid-binding protein
MALFVQETHTPKAEKILQEALANKTELVVPDLAYVECANVMWKYVRKGLCTPEKASEVLRKVGQLPLSSVPTRAIFEEAFHEGARLGVTAYDAVYVVLSRKLASPLVTGDKRLTRADIGGTYLGNV